MTIPFPRLNLMVANWLQRRAHDRAQTAGMIRKLEGMMPDIEHGRRRLADLVANCEPQSAATVFSREQSELLITLIRDSGFRVLEALEEHPPTELWIGDDTVMDALGVGLVWSAGASERACRREGLIVEDWWTSVWPEVVEEARNRLQQEGVDADRTLPLDQIANDYRRNLELVLTEQALDWEADSTALVDATLTSLHRDKDAPKSVRDEFSKEWKLLQLSALPLLYRALGKHPTAKSDDTELSARRVSS